MNITMVVQLYLHECFILQGQKRLKKESDVGMLLMHWCTKHRNKLRMHVGMLLTCFKVLKQGAYRDGIIEAV